MKGSYRVCTGGTYQAQLNYRTLADMACERITAGITRAFIGKRPITVVPDVFFFSSRRRHTRLTCDWSSDVCSSDLSGPPCHVPRHGTTQHGGPLGVS